MDKDESIKIPGPINTYLRDYQREGVKFFYNRFRKGRGGLLGDDMGLGKTIQVISFLAAIMKKTGCIIDENRRHKQVSQLQDGEDWKKLKKLPPADATWSTALIIAPTSVVPNWEREFRLVRIVPRFNSTYLIFSGDILTLACIRALAMTEKEF